MKKQAIYRFCLPESLLNKIEEMKRLPLKITGFSIARMEYLISTIVTHKQDNHPGAYSVLNMQYLKNIVPKADQYLNYLKEEGIIEWKNYSAGRNSRLYRITKKYDSKIFIKTITDNYLIRRIEQNIRRIGRKNSKKYPVLNKYVNMVKIDEPAALETIEKTYIENLKSSEEVKRNKAEARRTFSISEVFRITEGNIYIKVNTTNGRYNSNFTRLPSELVQHLSINGKKLIELDIRNSQPFFAVSLFNPVPETQKIIGDYFSMYAKSLQLSIKQDVILYTSLVTNGTFYDYMKEQFDEQGIPFDKECFKENLFTIFFGKNNSLHYSPSVQLFANIFPNILKLLEKIKEQHHNRLAILLQRIESFIMLERITPRIIKEYPELEFITKHDSLLPAGIMVTGKVDEIQGLMKDEIKRIVGHSPQIKIKS